MRRRTYLAGVAGLLGGCAASDPDDTADRTTTLSPEGTAAGGSTTATTTTVDAGPTTVKLAADQPLADHSDGLNRALHDAGLDGSIAVDPLAGDRTTITRQSKYAKVFEARKSEPTMFMMDSGWALTFTARGWTRPLDDLAPDGVASTVREAYFDPLSMTATGPDGAVHGLPLFVDVPTIQYRKDLFRKAGYGERDFRQWATDPPTWKRFADVVGTAREENDTRYGFTFQAAEYVGLSCCTFTEFVSSWGGAYFGDPSRYLFGPVGERPITVAERPVLDAIRMVRSFVHGPDAEHTLDGYPRISPEAVLEWTEEPSRKPFTKGKAVALRNWPYSILVNARHYNHGEDLGVMPIPYAVSENEARYPMTGGPTAALGGWHATVNPYASERKARAAGEVLDAMQAPSVQRWAARTLDWLPPRPSLFDDQLLSEADPLGRYLDSLVVGGQNAVPRPVTRRWPRQSEFVSERAHAALAGEQAPAQAMGALESRLHESEQAD